MKKQIFIIAMSLLAVVASAQIKDTTTLTKVGDTAPDWLITGARSFY